MKPRRTFRKEFKQTAVRRLESGQNLAEVARALEVHPSDLYRWRRELQEHGERLGRAGVERNGRDDHASQSERAAYYQGPGWIQVHRASEQGHPV